MATYTTTQDLIADVLWRAYEATDGSSQYAQRALDYLNRSYRSLWTGGAEFMPNAPQDWWWLRKDSSITMLPDYETGSIAVTQNSNIAVLSAAPTFSLYGYYLIVTGANAVYVITQHAANDVGVTLDSVYVDPTSGAAAFFAIPLVYSLPADCLKIIDPMVSGLNGGGKVYGSDLAEMLTKYPPVRLNKQTPQNFAYMNETQIRFSHFLDTYARFDFTYMMIPPDLSADPSSVPLVPLNYRHVLGDMAAFAILTDKEDQKAPGIGAQAKALIRAMAAENRKRWSDTTQAGLISPRLGRHKTWRRTTSGLRLWMGNG